MGTDAPHPRGALSITLRQGPEQTGSEIFQLGFPSFRKLNFLTIDTSSSTESWILVCAGASERPDSNTLVTKEYSLDVAAALDVGLLQLIDSRTGDVVSVPKKQFNHSGAYIPIAPKDPWIKYQKPLELNLDSTAQMWKDILKLGQFYQFRLSEDRGEVYALRSGEGQEQRHAVARDTKSRISFKVYDTPPAPKFSATMRTSSSICYSSGNPVFKWLIDLKSHCERPVTICKASTPFGVGEPVGICGTHKLVDCWDTETETPVDWSLAVGCWDSDPRISSENDYEEIFPGGVWTYEQALEDEDLECLAPGREYKAKLCEGAETIGNWLYGTKEQTMRGERAEVEARWTSSAGMRPPIKLINTPDEAVTFKVL